MCKNKTKIRQREEKQQLLPLKFGKAIKHKV